MKNYITLQDIKLAWDTKDYDLAELIINLVQAQDNQQLQPKQENVLTIQKFFNFIKSWDFKKKSDAEKINYRIEQLKTIESENAEALIPDRYQIYKIILELWKINKTFERQCLLKIVSEVPLKYGVWRALKRIFKDAEKSNDTEMLGALAARFEYSVSKFVINEVSNTTLMYLIRRGWRFLRQLKKKLPVSYPDVAVDFLRFYKNDTNWNRTWIFNHILHHETKKYNRLNFRFAKKPDELLKNRFAGELWKNSPRPLLTLLEKAQSEYVREYAITALKEDFKVLLRDVDVSWVIKLLNIKSAIIDEFVIWLLDYAPKFEQSGFKQLGLHVHIIKLLDSSSVNAQNYAAKYARTFSRDLPVEMLINLVNYANDSISKLGIDLLSDREPRNEVGLENWGLLLGTQKGHNLACAMIQKHFGASELSPDWFKERFLSSNAKVMNFVIQLLPVVLSVEILSQQFFIDILLDSRVEKTAADFALKMLKNFTIQEFSPEFVKIAFLHPLCKQDVQGWLKEEKVNVQGLGIDYFKDLAYQPRWDKSGFVNSLIASENRWLKNLVFDENLQDLIFTVIGDIRKFTPEELGVSWLFELLQHTNVKYQEFASKYMITHLKPEKFAGLGLKNAETQHCCVSTEVNTKAEISALSGCEVLLALATMKGHSDDSLIKFAIDYFNFHTSKEQGEKDNEIGIILPVEFFSYERFKILLCDSRAYIRKFAINISRINFARWNPKLFEIVELCECGFSDVQDFLTEALLSDKKKENELFRIDSENFDSDGVYSFLESLDDATRNIGMQIIDKNPKFAKPKELFRLTESPDRKVKTFVIKTFWEQYSGKGTSWGWKPSTLPESKMKLKSKKFKDLTDDELIGNGNPQKPEELPAGQEMMRDFLRQILFDVPPAKLPKKRKSEFGFEQLKMKPSRKSKIAMIEVVRDIAVENVEFASVVYPLLQEFLGSRGKSEKESCLVAVTRIKHAHQNFEKIKI